MMRNIYRNLQCQLRVVLQKKKVQKMLKISPPWGFEPRPTAISRTNLILIKPEYWELVEEENGRLGCRVKKADIRQCLKTTYFNPWRTMSAGGSPFLLPTLTTPSIWKVKQIEITESKKCHNLYSRWYSIPDLTMCTIIPVSWGSGFKFHRWGVDWRSFFSASLSWWKTGETHRNTSEINKNYQCAERKNKYANVLLLRGIMLIEYSSRLILLSNQN